MAFLNDMLARRGNRKFLAQFGIKSPLTVAMMRNLRKDHAAEIFEYEFWTPQELRKLCQPMGTVMYDLSVNHGKGGAARIMQQALNNSAGAGLTVDGAYGPRSRSAAKSLGSLEVALEAVRLRENYYRDIVARKPDQKVFLRGWLNRAEDLRNYVIKCHELDIGRGE